MASWTVHHKHECKAFASVAEPWPFDIRAGARTLRSLQPREPTFTEFFKRKSHILTMQHTQREKYEKYEQYQDLAHDAWELADCPSDYDIESAEHLMYIVMATAASCLAIY